MSALVALVFAVVGAAPPAIDGVSPSPLTRGAQAEVTGSGFVDGETLVTISGSVQKVALVEPAKVRFVVASDTPLGAGTLVVATSGGQAARAVEVAPAPPRITSVSPQPVVLGAPVTVAGTDLGAVDVATLGAHPCEITSQGAGELVCLPPLEPDLVGEVDLVVAAASGFDVATVEATPPVPLVDSLSPSPVAPGDLLRVAGTFVPWEVAVEVGGPTARIVALDASEVVVEVPPSLVPGDVDVVLRTGDVVSEPHGPLTVETPHPDRPVVERVIPDVVGLGGAAWIVGERLDGVAWSTRDLAVGDCGPRACRVLPETSTAGPFIGAVGSEDGAAVFEFHVAEDPAAQPVLSTLVPDPVRVGGDLTIHGDALGEVAWVVLGGVVQEMESVEADRLQVRVVPGTPVGTERLFVAGGSASEALEITVLEPAPDPEPGPELPPDGPPEGASDAGTQPAADVDAGVAGDPGGAVPAEEGTGGGGGCAGGPAGAVPWALGLLAWVARRRRT